MMNLTSFSVDQGVSRSNVDLSHDVPFSLYLPLYTN